MPKMEYLNIHFFNFHYRFLIKITNLKTNNGSVIHYFSSLDVKCREWSKLFSLVSSAMLSKKYTTVIYKP